MIRKSIHIIGLAACTLCSIFLIGRIVMHTGIPFHTPHTVVQRAESHSESGGRCITLDSGALTTLLARQLPSDFILRNLEIQIGEQGNLLCTAEISPETLELPQAAYMLLPDSCPLSAAVSIGYAEETVILQPLSLKINGLKLPCRLLQPAMEQLAQALTAGLRSQGISLQSISTGEGLLTIQLQP